MHIHVPHSWVTNECQNPCGIQTIATKFHAPGSWSYVKIPTQVTVLIHKFLKTWPIQITAISLELGQTRVPYYMKFWRHVNLAILKNPYLATL